MVRGLASWFPKCPFSLSLTALYELFKLHLHKELHLWYLISQLETLCNRECQLEMGKWVSWYVHNKKGKQSHTRQYDAPRWVLKNPKLRVLERLLFAGRRVLCFNGLNQTQDCPRAVCPLIIHQFMYSLSDPHLQCALHSTQLHDQASIICLATSLLLLLPKHFFQPPAAHSEWSCCLIFILTELPSSPPPLVVRFKILRAQTPVPQGQGYALVTAGHLVLLCLHIFPHGHHSSSCWVPEGGMTLPPWPPVVHHLLKTRLFKHLRIYSESFFSWFLEK